jgi:hypothetical protein
MSASDPKRTCCTSQPRDCYFACKLGSEGEGLSRTVQWYPASRSRAAMRAAIRWGSFCCWSVEVVADWTVIKDCTTASFRYDANTPRTTEFMTV